MKKGIFLLIILLGWILIIKPVKSQDVNFTQYFSTPLYNNPAFTGINTGIKACILFPDPWPSLPVVRAGTGVILRWNARGFRICIFINVEELKKN
jgi:hypothetical protein